jgi:ATP-dependent DNA helicase PIF1
MRVYLCGGDDIFSAQLLKIGNGTLENENGYISVNHTIGRVVNNAEELISTVYPDIFNLSNKSYQWLCERAIISLRNVTAGEINDIILLKFYGHSREYLSIDTVTSTDDAIHYLQEFLNSLSPSGFLPHKLKLKIGAPITLLRNLQPPNLCNGTRLQIKSLQNNIIEDWATHEICLKL